MTYIQNTAFDPASKKQTNHLQLRESFRQRLNTLSFFSTEALLLGWPAPLFNLMDQSNSNQRPKCSSTFLVSSNLLITKDLGWATAAYTSEEARSIKARTSFRA
jgi:hypothetical protein